jgi:hypothetical protein
MSHRWYVTKLFFDWVPFPLPGYERKDGDFILFVPDLHPEVIYLNGPGAFLLHQCDGTRTVKEIMTRYMVEFLRSDRDDVGYEVVSLLRQLEALSAIYLLPPAPFGDAQREVGDALRAINA